METYWYKNAFHRNVIDMHITDCDDRFLSRFDARKYVEMLKLSESESAVVYAHSVVGLCNYPTRVGEMHKGLRGRDILREMIEECHRNGIKVVVYNSVIYDSWAYNHCSDWRVMDVYGNGMTEQGGRRGLCCPNSGYRDYVLQRTEEICRNYDFEGIRFDMTFWPREVCYCKHCQARYDREIGGEMPKIVDWLDAGWVRFQRARERWLTEFAGLATSCARGLKANISVEHQASTFIHRWQYGVTLEFSKQNDFLQGDFYGGYTEGSFACKLYYNLSENLPYGFETCSNVDLADHITLKSKELLEAKVCMALANGGAFVFIHGIDPLGTLNPRVYETMGSIFKKTRLYEAYLGGQLREDVAIYVSMESKFDYADNGKFVADASLNTPHVDAALKAAKALIEHHVPYGVITKRNLKQLAQYRVIVLPNVLMMDEEEVEEIRKYVFNGGALYASKYTSLVTKDGEKQDNFLLSDVLGVAFAGETGENFTYIGPTPEGQAVFSAYSVEYPLSIYGTQMRTKAAPGTVVLGKTVLPYTDPEDRSQFAALHSNPPGVATEFDAVALHRFGAGRALYVSGDLENVESHHAEFVGLLRLLAEKPFSLESNAPKAVEITTFHQAEARRYILNLLNFQEKMPNIPVYRTKIRMEMEAGQSASQVFVVSTGESLPFAADGHAIEFTVPCVETFAMISVQYE